MEKRKEKKNGSEKSLESSRAYVTVSALETPVR